jgi:uncharacterized membrane protein HdeD (DUF308 family)
MIQEAELVEHEIDITAEEFQDYDGQLAVSSADFDFSHLVSPASLRGVAAIVVSLLVLQVPDRSPKTLGVLLAVILVAWSVGGIVQLRDTSQRSPLNVARVAVLLILAGGLIIWPTFSIEQLGRAAGVALIAGALFNAYNVLSRVDRGKRLEPLIGAILYLAIGAALIVSPETILGLAILLVSTYWFIAGVLAVVTNIRRDDERQVQPSQTWRDFLSWIQTRPSTADDRRQLYDKIFYEGAEAQRRLCGFLC